MQKSGKEDKKIWKHTDIDTEMMDKVSGRTKAAI